MHQRIPACQAVVQGLQRRGGGGEQHVRSVYASQHHGGVARSVARGGVLLVGDVVLFLHYDQAEILERQEQGGPGA